MYYPINGKSNESKIYLRSTRWRVKEYTTGKLKEKTATKKKQGKKEKREPRTGKERKNNNKMGDLKPSISAITLHIDRLRALEKRQKLSV